MPTVRRTSERRRRVLYQAHVASTDASGRPPESSLSREAREPASQFGSRVNRHLRARWFSLVPVTRRAMICVTSAALGLTAMLVIAHHLAVTWPPLTVRDSISRPLRLDRADSFAAWWLTMNLLITAGASYLIYGLRLHRRDDYRGHYQLWRLTTVVMLVACVHSVVGLVDWVGAFLDLGLGDRAVLSGGRWLRILIDVGGTILFLRLVHEVYRCRPALVAILLAATSFAVLEAAAWNVFVIDSIGRSTLALAAPIVGCSMLMLGFVGYLRLLFRQVRRIEDGPSLRERFEQWKTDRKNLQAPIESDFFAGALDLRPAAADVQVRRRPTASTTAPNKKADEPENEAETQHESSENDTEFAASPKQRRGLLDRLKRRKKASQKEASGPATEVEPEHEVSEDVDSDAIDETQPSDQSDKPKRNWFRLKRKPAPVDNTDDQEHEGEAEEVATKQKRKGWFSMRLKPPKDPQASEQSDSPVEESPAAGKEDEQPSTTKPGLFARLKAKLPKRTPKADSEEEGESDDTNPEDSPRQSESRASKRARRRAEASQDSVPEEEPVRRTPAASTRSASSDNDTDSDQMDPDDIDWDSLSKSERRRLRKQLRRSGRAA
ncbi:hypothetical protein U8335_14570 [Roseiconus lacunae]|uniref:hypothetical protein n=1 Tax=Roseiconus lacunae TaxID=2605694 RepID=UPI0030857D75|nr:hypothetical protein U8335_14570 [Stieleria sp. HD01]